ncbi:MAG: HNH endonuclease [Actinomycetota bacterium]|nr:HNH endonuclease [Actinomycetota bacterium]
MEETATAEPLNHARLAPGAVELERRFGVVERLREADRNLARAAAERLECIDELRREAEAVHTGRDARDRVRFDTSTDMQRRSVRAELAAASRISERAAETQLAMAEALMTELTATMDALRAGDIFERHARLIWEHWTQVPAGHRPEFETRALAAARKLSPARLASKLRDLQERLHPEAATERHHSAVDTREAWLDPCADGMAILSAKLPAVQAVAAMQRIDQYARGLAADPNDTRTLAQIRADLVAEFLLTGQVGDVTIVPTAHVVVPALSLAGQSEELAILDGYGPIDLATARNLLADAEELIRLITHPVTGTILAVDSYKPPKALRRWLQIRDETCRHPGCGRRATDCELDHTLERVADNGPTAFDNLAHVCINHHKLKTVTGWTYRHLDRFGTLEWTSPLGEKYIDEPAVRMRGAPHRDDTIRQRTLQHDEPPPEFDDRIPDDLYAEFQAAFDAELEADLARLSGGVLSVGLMARRE